MDEYTKYKIKVKVNDLISLLYEADDEQFVDICIDKILSGVRFEIPSTNDIIIPIDIRGDKK